MLETIASLRKECVECKKTFHICKFRRFSRIHPKCNKCQLISNIDYQKNMASRGNKMRFNNGGI